MSSPTNSPDSNALPESPPWTARRCVACEGGMDPLDAETAAAFCQSHPNWAVDDDGRVIRCRVNTQRFQPAVDRLVQIAALAEAEQHHPDLHLTGYRHLTIELTTHAIGGLSENDLILAAKIDQLLASPPHRPPTPSPAPSKESDTEV